MLDRAREVFDVEIEGLRKTRDSLGDTFVAAVELILSALRSDGHVVVTGVGKSLHVAEKMSGIFSSTGARSFVLNPVQAMHGDLGATSTRDVLVALSFSGESEEVLRLIPAIRRHGLKVISLTGNSKSTLAGLSDVHVEIPCGKEACPFGMAPTTSATATMVMGDALAMALLYAQKFEISDYALNHPAGAIGRALVMRASDVMRTGDRLPLVPPTATVMATLMAMTKAQSGSAVVVDESGRLTGIFTDGDFRRLVSIGSDRVEVGSDRVEIGSDRVEVGSDRVKDSNQTLNDPKLTLNDSNQTLNDPKLTLNDPKLTLSDPNQTLNDPKLTLNDPIVRHMTRSPLFVRDDVYAAELLKIFEVRRIDDLPVVDASGRVVGLVDIQDLPKMKVM